MKKRIKSFYLILLEIFTRANFNFKSKNFKKLFDFNLSYFHNDTISTEISINGYFEREQLEILDTLIKKKQIFIDIGANIGNHTLYFRNKFKKIYCFEPHPKIFKVLKLNTEDYKNIRVFPLGISNSKNRLYFKPKKSNNISGTNFKKEIKNKGRIVHFKKLDKIINSKSISFVKIDVEGNEFDVLKSMNKNLLKNNMVIQLEFNPKEFSEENKIIKFLKEKGYENFYFFSTNKPLNLRIINLPYIFWKVFFLNYKKKVSLNNINELPDHRYFLKDNIIISKDKLNLNFLYKK